MTPEYFRPCRNLIPALIELPRFGRMDSVCPICQNARLVQSRRDPPPKGKTVLICTDPLCTYQELVLHESCCEYPSRSRLLPMRLAGYKTL